MNPLMRRIVLASMLLSGVTVGFVMIAPGIVLVDDSESGPSRERLSGAAAIAQETKPPRVGNPVLAIPLQRLSETRERPIFSLSRRPAPTPVGNTPRVTPVVVPLPEPEQLQLSLIGTVISERIVVGIFMEEATKNVFRLGIGEAHKGWILHFLQSRQAALQKNGRTVEVTLPSPAKEPVGSSLQSAELALPPQGRRTRSR
jgi:hypothetical protein